ncbi:hypothetical protein MHZ92_03650 [Sporosarcina sp. ACRSL]|uniref:hypothetical protein n=1 Tax=Sporosarcina sp. ACRSL TaxID=2918215 RepID=UPI001EF52544|nr:hypothetical protein [Sporosarcina sp. ACRSL]MCG7343214.1 hypothetical protein [Sporosarcina sp. ACRSL]
MKEIYRKTSIAGFISGIGMILFCILYYFIWYEGFSVNGDVLFEVGIGGLFALGAGVYFKKAYEKLTDPPVVESAWDMEAIGELNLKRVPSLLPKFVHVDHNGQPLFQIQPTKGRLRNGLLFFSLFEKGMVFPVEYDIASMDGLPIATIRIKNNVKQFLLTLKKPDGTVLGQYIQHLSKSAMKNRGTLYHADGTVWRQLEANNMAGDIDVTDEDGNRTASYRYGLFPYATLPAFQSTAHHEHVSFGAHISSDEKFAYVMIFFFWLDV